MTNLITATLQFTNYDKNYYYSHHKHMMHVNKNVKKEAFLMINGMEVDKQQSHSAKENK